MLSPRVFVSYAKTDQNGDLLVRVAKELLRIRWLERGSAIVLQTRLHNGPRPDLLMAAHMSSAAQLAATEAGVGWLDETGAAQFAVGTVVVSRTSAPIPATNEQVERWTGAKLGITEALLTGVPGTVRALVTATGASPSTAGLALNSLTHTGLLTSQAVRGRNSGRTIADPSRLLEAYADAVTRARQAPGVQSRCLVARSSRRAIADRPALGSGAARLGRDRRPQRRGAVATSDSGGTHGRVRRRVRPCHGSRSRSYGRAEAPRRRTAAAASVPLTDHSPPFCGSQSRTAQRAGLIADRRVGNTRLLRAADGTPLTRPLTDLLAVTYGPLPVLTDALRSVPGVERAYIYGSWAARYVGEIGPVPADVDVLAIGTVDLDDLEEAARQCQPVLRREVNIRRIRADVWDAEGASDPFLTSVRSKPLVELDLRQEAAGEA